MRRDRDLLAQVPLTWSDRPLPARASRRPEAAVLDQEPVVDPARRRAERLVVLARDIGAEAALRLGAQSASCVTTQITWPVVTGCPGRPTARTPRRRACAVISFSIFIASTMQTTWPASTVVALGDLDREHGALHRAHDRVAGRRRDGRAARARSRRRRASSACGGSGLEERDLEAAPVDLGLDDLLPEPSVRRRQYACCLMRQLLRPLRKLLRLDDAVARLARDEARVLEQRAVEADERRDALDLVLAERAQHPAARVLAVDAVDAQLGDQRVVEADDLAALGDAGIDAHARPGRLAVARDPPGRRQEAGGRVLGVDAALDRVPASAERPPGSAIAAHRPRSAPARGRGRGP